MDRCPPEVLHQICGKLDFVDVAALRLLGRKYAAVGAEYLVDKVRFHASASSIDRLKSFVQHPVFSQHIKSVTYEGSLLADIKCEHNYAEHFQSPHHADERPVVPSVDCTDRELRLYERNFAKFKNDVSRKYKEYRKLYDTQHQFLEDISYARTVATCSNFPKLEHVSLTNVGRCRHMLSERFLQAFAVGCAVPMEQDSDATVTQLRLLLIPPSGKPLMGLKSLIVNVLDPSFFISKSLQPKISQVFRSLKIINLSFRRNKEDRIIRQFEDNSAYNKLSKGGLRDALTAAEDLEELRLAFNDIDYTGPVVSLKHILDDNHAWPKLRLMDLECIFTDQEYLLSTLQHQPELKIFCLAWTVLKNGTWPETVLEMRKKLSLNSFLTSGLLEDSDSVHNVDNIDGEAFFDGDGEISLSDRLDMFVCDKEYMEEMEDEFSPFDDAYDDRDALQADMDQLHQEMLDEMEETSSHDDCDDREDEDGMGM